MDKLPDQVKSCTRGHEELDQEISELVRTLQQEPSESLPKKNEELLDKKLRIVRQYSRLKDELTRKEMGAIADELFKYDHLDLDELKQIADKFCSRGKASELLLKIIINGTQTVIGAFMKILNTNQRFERIRKIIEETQISDEEKKRFIVCEDISLGRQDPSSISHSQQFHLSNSDSDVLISELNDEELVDPISDSLFSNFYMSCRDHKRIVNLESARDKVKELISQMKNCSDSVYDVFASILEEKQLHHVLQNRTHYLKRKVPGLDNSSAPVYTRTEATEQHVASSAEQQVVSNLSTAEGSKRLKKEADKLGLEYKEACIGCIELHFTPKYGQSLEKLQTSCTTGEIKKFVQHVFEETGVESKLGEGDSRWNIGINLQGGSSRPFLFEKGTLLKGTKLRHTWALLVEEIDPWTLLANLQARGLLGKDDEMLKLESRKDNVKFLLERLMTLTEPDLRCKILIDHCKEHNEYILQNIQEKDILQTFYTANHKGEGYLELSALADKRSEVESETQSHQEKIFTAAVILSISKKESVNSLSKDPDLGPDSDKNIVISCDILEHKCHFDERDASGVNTRNHGPWSVSDNIRSPQYQQCINRLPTYACWPSHTYKTPDQLARAGFYYTGFHDVVRCFACDGGFKNWDPDDDPWVEHARWFPQCPFVKHVKGQEFIEFVQLITKDSDEEDRVVLSTFQPKNPIADSPDLRNEFDPQLDQADEENAADLQKEDVIVLEQAMEPLDDLAVADGASLEENADDLQKEGVIVLENLLELLNDRAVADGADEKENAAHLPKEDVMVLEHTVEVLNDTDQGPAADASGVTTRIHGPCSASDRIRIPYYHDYSVQLSTFARWPNDIKQRPEQVADAGFYYRGSQDTMCCYVCDGGLKNWYPDDDPWIEHALWFPQGAFVKHVKGQEFIDPVQKMTRESKEEEDAVVYHKFWPNNLMADAPDLRKELYPQHDQEPKKQETELDLNIPEALVFLDLGCSRNATSMAINELRKRGKTTINVSDIADVLLSFEERGISLSADGDAKENDSAQDHTGLYRCGGDLQKWEPGDNPRIEHSRWYPECPHVQKGAQDHTGLYLCGGGLQKWEPGDDPWIEHCRWYPECPRVQKGILHKYVFHRCVSKLVMDLDVEKLSIYCPEKEHFDDVKECDIKKIGLPVWKNSSTAAEKQVVGALRTASTRQMFWSASIEHLGMEFQEVYSGSIIIRFTTDMGKSLQKLKEACATGKIRDFLPNIFMGTGVESKLGLGDFKWKFWLYKEPCRSSKLFPQEAEKMHQCVLNQCLVRNLDVKTVCMYIQQRGVLDDVTVRDILEQPTTSDMIREVIQQIQQRDRDTYEKFKECLVQAKQAFIKEMLEEEEAKFAKEIEVSVPEIQNEKLDPIKLHWSLFVEELDPRKLFADLEGKGLLGSKDGVEMLKFVSRKDRMKFLLERLHTLREPDLGYEILLDHCKEHDEYVLQKIKEKEDLQASSKHQEQSTSVGKRSDRPSDQELIFSATIILSVRRKVSTSSMKKNTGPISDTEFEISCLNVLEPVCYFNDMGEDVEGDDDLQEIFMKLEEVREPEEERLSIKKQQPHLKRKRNMQIDA